MSSSTVLFAANQEVRRRQGAMGDDEPGIGLVDGDGESNGRINGGVVEDGIKINSRRKSRHGSRKRSRCPTLATLFTANLLCLLLAQMAMRFALRNENSFMVNFLGIPAFEGKMENEIKGLRRELRQKIEDEVVIFQNELRKLDGRTESMEKWLGEFRANGLMNKEDFDEFYDELKKAKGDEVLSLDYVREYAKEIIEKEIEKHAADGLGKVDYALASGGAVVWWHSEPFNNGKSKNGVQNDAEKMLKPSFGEPGECFPLKGSSGFVQIRLRTAIIPEAITLEHVAKSVAYDRSSAPKDCRVTGWLQGKGTELRVDSEKILVLANFSYDLNKSNAQTFNVVGPARSTAVDMIRFDFTSNHGTASHTCIYRLRVHGHEPASV